MSRNEKHKVQHGPRPRKTNLKVPSDAEARRPFHLIYSPPSSINQEAHSTLLTLRPKLSTYLGADLVASTLLFSTFIFHLPVGHPTNSRDPSALTVAALSLLPAQRHIYHHKQLASWAAAEQQQLATWTP